MNSNPYSLTMSITPTKIFSSFRCISFHFSSTHTLSSLQHSIQTAIESKNYQQIPEFLTDTKDHCQNPNPFSFLSKLAENQRVHVIDQILQSFIPIRPRSKPRIAYSYLLSYTLQNPNPLPLSLAIVQRILRSGCLPVPQTHLLLANSWVEKRTRSQSVASLLSEMETIGYSPDTGTCNYLISSLCKVDRLNEAVKVLKGMGRAGCIADLDSYGTIIGEMSERRMISEVVEMVKEMVCKQGVTPRQEMVVKVIKAMRGNREIWRAVEMIEFLESEDVHVAFDGYASVLDGCLECRQFVLAGKFVVRMTERGFIPYIRVRQKLVEGLAGIGELELAAVVKQRFVNMKS